jgi:hypothetical protein
VTEPEPTRGTVVVYLATAMRPMTGWTLVWWATSRLVAGMILAWVLWSVLDLPGLFGALIGVLLWVGVLAAAGPRAWPRRPCIICGTQQGVQPIPLPMEPWKQWWLRWLPARVPVNWVCDRDFVRWVEQYVAGAKDDHADHGAVDQGRDQ